MVVCANIEKEGVPLMTDKELRKLNRLELLELLLEASKENKKLKEQIKQLQLENKTTQNIENLSVITGQMETALRYANNITDTLRPSSKVTDNGKDNGAVSRPDTKAQPLSDVEIYKRMLLFFANNDEKLSVFPDDIKDLVRARLRSIRERKNN